MDLVLLFSNFFQLFYKCLNNKEIFLCDFEQFWHQAKPFIILQEKTALRGAEEAREAYTAYCKDAGLAVCLPLKGQPIGEAFTCECHYSYITSERILLMASRSSLFPFIVSGPFATYRGDFYANKGDHWRKIELYLPGSPSTYGDETLQDTASRFLDQLNKGRAYRYAVSNGGNINTNPYQLEGEKFVAAKQVFKA